VRPAAASAFHGAYREDGHGRAAHDPAMMVALRVYADAIGVRSSRAIERRCRGEVAFCVIIANQAPDHATIARFRVRHERAIGELRRQLTAQLRTGRSTRGTHSRRDARADSTAWLRALRSSARRRSATAGR
jgi:transposase